MFPGGVEPEAATIAICMRLLHVMLPDGASAN